MTAWSIVELAEICCGRDGLAENLFVATSMVRMQKCRNLRASRVCGFDETTYDDSRWSVDRPSIGVVDDRAAHSGFFGNWARLIEVLNGQ